MDQGYNAEISSDLLANHGGEGPCPGATGAEEGKPESYDVFFRIGHLTRKLHDALRELGYDHQLESTVGSLPDARARLSYIADVTGKAAEKVLGLVDEKIASDDAFADQVKNIALVIEGSGSDTQKISAVRQFLGCAQNHCDQSRSMMTDIMMAQDFHDLTGQTIKKVADIAHNVEQQLVQLLLDTTPPTQRNKTETQFMEGPVVDKTRADSVHNQEQVDDLLAQLGF